jgi:hypothetical protein
MVGAAWLICKIRLQSSTIRWFHPGRIGGILPETIPPRKYRSEETLVFCRLQNPDIWKKPWD